MKWGSGEYRGIFVMLSDYAHEGTITGPRSTMQPSGPTAFLLMLGATVAIRNVTIDAPETVLSGQEINFYCHYDLEDDQLYSVRWYFFEDEFFSYRPNHKTDTKIFRRKGLHVEPSRSNGSQVVLIDVQKHAAGQYSCEVTGEAPGFHTVVASTKVQVIDGPKEHPQIHGLEARYRAGQILKANCSSPPSKPPVQLNWKMNGESQKAADWGFSEDNFGRSASWSLLYIPMLKEHHFRHGKIKVRCLAKIENAYWHVEEKSVESWGYESDREQKQKQRQRQKQRDQEKAIHEEVMVDDRSGNNKAISSKAISNTILVSILLVWFFEK